MKRKKYAILMIMAIIFSASSLCVLSRSQDSVPEPDPTLVYEFSIEYSDQNSKYNTLTDLTLIARKPFNFSIGDQFLAFALNVG